MASLWKHPRSKYWTACYTNKDGKQVKRSTKLTDRKQARTVAMELERVEQKVRQGTMSTLQIQKILNDLVEKTTGDTIMTPTVEDYLKEWLTNAKAKNSEATAERYGHTVDQFLKHLGNKKQQPMTAITAAHIEGFMSSRLKGGVAPKTAIVDIRTLNVVFHRAERYGVILKNPVTAVEMPKAISSEREIFTPEQVKKLLDTVGYKDEWFTLILMGYYTGARLSDCATMKWENVNFRDHVLTYEQRKTAKVVRVPLVEDLDNHLNTMREFIDGDYICPELAERGSAGKAGLSESFNRIVKRAKIDPLNIQGKGKLKFKRLTFHSLRHSFNSALANAGVTQEIRMRLTGHSSTGMNDRYTHQALGPLEAAVSHLPSLNDQAEKPEPETRGQRLAREKAEHEAGQIPEPGPRIAPVLGDL
jgi:integrase